MANYLWKKFFLPNLKLSHITDGSDERTTTMPIARPLLKYGRLKTM